MNIAYYCLSITGLALIPLAASLGDDARIQAENTSGADAVNVPGSLLFDFGTFTSIRGWIEVNDNVMGGKSEGGLALEDGHLVFSGRTNTDGGGFSSIRGTLPEGAALGGADGLMVRLRGSDARAFKLDLRQARAGRNRWLAYRADIPMEGHGDWEEVRIPFAAFSASWRGQLVDGANLDPGQVTGLGLFIYDGRDGPFRLEVDRIETYRDED